MASFRNKLKQVGQKANRAGQTVGRYSAQFWGVPALTAKDKQNIRRGARRAGAHLTGGSFTKYKKK